MNADHASALHLYTLEGPFYRQLNAALRDHDRSKAKPFFPFLRLFFDALEKLSSFDDALWRGVNLDLTPQYPKGSQVTWWGVSSCTSQENVARGFMKNAPKSTLFRVKPLRAVSIMDYSAFKGEAEYILPPGSRFVVESITKNGGISLITLSQIEGGCVN
jgi:hypothetical protein